MVVENGVGNAIRGQTFEKFQMHFRISGIRHLAVRLNTVQSSGVSV